MAWTWNVDDESPDNGPNLTAMAVVLSTASLLSVLSRAYVRFYLLKAVGAGKDDPDADIPITAPGIIIIVTYANRGTTEDDWAIIIAWLLQETKWGLGLRNQGDVPEQNEYNIILIQFISAPFLLFSYLRIIPGRRWRITIITVAVGCIMFHFIYLVVQMSRCLPPGAAWSPSIATGFCVAPVPFFISMASITMVFDLVVMFLPFPTLWQSRIQKRRKAVLLGLFATGLFITVIQISYIEANLAIVVVCVPTLSPLATYFAEIKTSRTGTTTGTWTGSRGTRAATAAPVPSSSSSSAYALQPWRPDGAAEGRKEGRIVVSREVSVTTGDNADSRNESQESMIQHDHHASQGRIMKKTEFHMVHDAADVV
ncbi:hypothetical protein PG989_001795 [Apiospora arundinis]